MEEACSPSPPAPPPQLPPSLPPPPPLSSGCEDHWSWNKNDKSHEVRANVFGSPDHQHCSSGATLRSKTADCTFPPKLVKWDGWGARDKVGKTLEEHSIIHTIQSNHTKLLNEIIELCTTGISSAPFILDNWTTSFFGHTFTPLSLPTLVQFAGFSMAAGITGRSTSPSGSLAPA